MRVLIIDIDSLRPDHLGCYGYNRNTSPTIDRVADNGARFTECFVSDSPCLPSRTALATGRVGARNGVVTHHGSGQWLGLYDTPGTGSGPPADRPLSFQYLSEEGIHTTTITSFAKRHGAYHFTAAFRESIQPTTSKGAEQASDVTAAATDWLDRHADENDWLLHVNYWDVHHPYNGIDGLVDEVRESGDAVPWPNQEAIDAQDGVTGPRTGDIWPNARHYRERAIENGVLDHGEWDMPVSIDERSDVEHVIDGYDASIRKVDGAVQTILDSIEEAGVREETAIVVTGDHGEALGEHGVYAEHAFAHPPCQHVPMIVDWPGTPSRNVDAKIYQFDLVATLCERAGLDVPTGWDAESFSTALDGEEFDGRRTLVCGHGIYTFGRAVYRDDWAFIRVLDPGVFSHPGLYNDPQLPNRGLELLHDLDSDPHMTENLIDDRPEKAAELRTALDETTANWIATTDAAGEDPLVRMAVEDGPYLYVDPEEFADLYGELGRSDRQRAVVEEATESSRSV